MESCESKQEPVRDEFIRIKKELLTLNSKAIKLRDKIVTKGDFLTGGLIREPSNCSDKACTTGWLQETQESIDYTNNIISEALELIEQV